MVRTSHGRSVVYIRATAQKHAGFITQVLPAHVISGCDTVAYLWGTGKGTIVKILTNGFQLRTPGELNAAITDVITEATELYAACYGSRERSDMSAVRFDVWSSKMAKKITVIVLQSLPPTTNAIRQHVYRAHFQAALWRAVLDADPQVCDHPHHGWSHDQISNIPLPVRFPPDVSPAPTEVLNMIQCGCSSARPCSTNRCSCSAARLSCSMFCGCHGMAWWNVKMIRRSSHQQMTLRMLLSMITDIIIITYKRVNLFSLAFTMYSI